MYHYHARQKERRQRRPKNWEKTTADADAVERKLVVRERAEKRRQASAFIDGMVERGDGRGPPTDTVFINREKIDAGRGFGARPKRWDREPRAPTDPTFAQSNPAAASGRLSGKESAKARRDHAVRNHLRMRTSPVPTGGGKPGTAATKKNKKSKRNKKNKSKAKLPERREARPEVRPGRRPREEVPAAAIVPRGEGWAAGADDRDECAAAGAGPAPAAADGDEWVMLPESEWIPEEPEPAPAAAPVPRSGRDVLGQPLKEAWAVPRSEHRSHYEGTQSAERPRMVRPSAQTYAPADAYEGGPPPRELVSEYDRAFVSRPLAPADRSHHHRAGGFSSGRGEGGGGRRARRGPAAGHSDFHVDVLWSTDPNEESTDILAPAAGARAPMVSEYDAEFRRASAAAAREGPRVAALPVVKHYHNEEHDIFLRDGRDGHDAQRWCSEYDSKFRPWWPAARAAPSPPQVQPRAAVAAGVGRSTKKRAGGRSRAAAPKAAAAPERRRAASPSRIPVRRRPHAVDASAGHSPRPSAGTQTLRRSPLARDASAGAGPDGAEADARADADADADGLSFEERRARYVMGARRAAGTQTPQRSPASRDAAVEATVPTESSGTMTGGGRGGGGGGRAPARFQEVEMDEMDFEEDNRDYEPNDDDDDDDDDDDASSVASELATEHRKAFAESNARVFVQVPNWSRHWVSTYDADFLPWSDPKYAGVEPGGSRRQKKEAEERRIREERASRREDRRRRKPRWKPVSEYDYNYMPPAALERRHRREEATGHVPSLGH